MELLIILIFSMFMAGIFTLMAAFLTLVRLIKYKNVNLNYILFNWIFWGIGWILIGFGHWDSNKFLFDIAYTFQIIGTYGLLMFTEYNAKTHINTVKISILTAICTLYLFFVYQPDSMQYIENYGFHVLGEARLFQIMFSMFYSYLYVEWIVKVFKYSPTKIRENNANRLFLSGVVMAILPVISYMLAPIYLIFGPLAFFIHAIGIFIFVTTLVKEPKLFFILPFLAHKLIIIDRNTGKMIYEHTWTEKKFKKKLLLPIITGIVQMSRDVLTSGHLNQLKLRQASVLFDHQERYSVALIANQPSNHLKSCIRRFTSEFKQNVGAMVSKKQTKVKDQKKENYEFIDNLVRKHFTSIPTRT